MRELMVLAGFLVVISAVMAYLGFRGREQIVGIDLGTTFSVVAIKYTGQKGRVDVIPNHITGKNLLPSVVSYLPNGTVLVGHSAIAQRSDNPLRTIYNAKRFIGKSFHECHNDSETHPYRVRPNPNTSATTGRDAPDDVQVGFSIPRGSDDADVWRSPVDVGSEVIKVLKQQVLEYVGYPIHRAVICVPAKFGRHETEATRDAFVKAGFKVMRIMDEPTAAAVAYNLHHFQGVKYVLVYDIGGGTLDASVLYMNGKNVNVLGIAGDDHLGGSDFDHRMTLILEEKLDKAPSESGSSVTGADIPGCHRDSMRLLAEQAKIELSSAMSAEVRCRDDAGAVRTLSITRAEFQERSSDLFARCLEPVSKALEDQVMRPEHIDDIVLVGGTSRMPRIRELLQEYFGPTKTLHTEIDPDVTIAYGAANIVD